MENKKSNSKQGRAPIAQKTESMGSEFGSLAKSMTDIPAECQKELDAKGLEGRWIDIVQLKKNHGWHKREWNPVKFDCLGKNVNPFAASEGQYEGFLIRSQLVLAGKPIEKAEQRRAHIQMLNKRQSDPAGLSKQDFSKYVKENDAKSKVTGWDEKDEKET